MKTLYEKVEPDANQQGFGDMEASIGARFSGVYQVVAGSIEPLNQPIMVKYRDTGVMVEQYLKEYNILFEKDVADFKKSVSAAGISLFKEFKPLSLN